MMTRQAVVAFPLDHRRKLVADLVAQMTARSPADTEKHLAAQLRRQAAALARKQIPEARARTELAALERAVRAELWRMVMVPPQPSGKGN